MNDFRQAADAVSIAIEQGRVGVPVAARIVLTEANDAARLEPQVALALRRCAQWYAAEPQSITAFGGAETGHIGALALFPRGQTAVVCVSLAGEHAPLCELVLAGARGMISWEPGACGTSAPPRAETSDAATDELQSRLRAALAANAALGAADKAPSSAEQPPALKPLPPPYGLLLVSGSYTHQENYGRAFAADARCQIIGVTDESDVAPRRRELNERLAAELSVPYFPDLDSALCAATCRW